MSARAKMNLKIKKALERDWSPLFTPEEKMARLSGVLALGATITGKQAQRILTTGKM